MAEWKKVIVSGSNADLAEVTSSGGFIGNLAGNVTGNASTATALANARTINGTSFDGTGNITLGNDSVTNAMMADDAIDSDQIAANAVTTAKITDANVTLAKIANAAANTVIVRDANSSGVLSAKAVTNTQILIGDGTGFTAAALSSDVTMTNAGAVTIANNAVSLAKMAGLARGKIIVGDSSGDPSALSPGGANTVLQSDGTDITYNTVATAMIADNAVDGDKLADDITIAGALTVVGGASASFFSSSGEIVTQGNIISTSGSFSGDGSNLTGVAAASVNIDGLSALGGTGVHQTQDHFMFSDNGTEKKITFSNLQDAIFADVSGDAAIAAGGALTIAADSVENSMLANITRGSIKVGGASNAPTDLDAKTNGRILIGDGTDINSVAVSGDISLSGDGATEIAANAVTLAKMAGLARGKIIHGDSSGDPAALAVGSANTVLQSDGTDISYNTVATAMIADNAVSLAKMAGLARGKIIHGDSSGDPAALSPGGANTVLQSDGTDISYNTVATAMIADNAVTIAKMAGLARGKIIAGDSSGDPAALALGSANTVLQSDGTDLSYGTIATDMIANDAVTGDKLANDITIANDLTVTRDLIVNGTSVTVNTANLNVEDPFILLKSGSSNTSDSGIIFGGSTGTANSGKALVWDASYNSNDGRLAVSTTAVAGDATANFDGSGTAGYYIAGVFAGSESDAATAKADHAGNIRIESSEIYIYV